MELESQGMPPYAKSLMGSYLRGCQQVRSGRDIKRIPMPMQDGHPLQITERGQTPVPRQGYGSPPYFPGLSGINAAAEGMGHHLSSEAYAQQRLPTFQTHADQIQFRLQIGIRFRIPHPYGTAQHHAQVSLQPFPDGRTGSARPNVPCSEAPVPEKRFQRTEIFKSHMAQGQASAGC